MSLRRLLGERLPDYMVPSVFVMLDAMPLNANRKVDRRALPAPEEVRPDLEEAYAAPQTPTELLVAEIWQEVLGLERVGVYDNFFDLGGHSLLAMQVVARLEERLGLRVGAGEMVQQTLGQFAAACDERVSAFPQSASRPIVQRLWRAIKTAVSQGGGVGR
jgi:acyl carrier protein